MRTDAGYPKPSSCNAGVEKPGKRGGVEAAAPSDGNDTADAGRPFLVRREFGPLADQMKYEPTLIAIDRTQDAFGTHQPCREIPDCCAQPRLVDWVLAAPVPRLEFVAMAMAMTVMIVVMVFVVVSRLLRMQMAMTGGRG